MAYREFTDHAGVAWEVWEVHPTLTERRHLADRRGMRRDTPERRAVDVPRIALARELRRGWLAFRSKFERRRHTPVPECWDELSDDGLCALLKGSRLSGPVRRLAE
jgi:hypothetical protein